MEPLSVQNGGAQLGSQTPRELEDDGRKLSREPRKLKKERARLVRHQGARFVIRPGSGFPPYELAEFHVNSPAALAEQISHLSCKRWWSENLRAQLVECVGRHFGWPSDGCRWLPAEPSPETSAPVIVADPLKAAGFLAALLERMAKQ